MRCHSLFLEIPDLPKAQPSKTSLVRQTGRCPSWRRVYCARSISSAEPVSSTEPARRPLQNTVRLLQCRQKPKVGHMAKVAFLGLGVMGFPMAGHLVKKGGHEVTVFNRTAAKAKTWVEKFGGKTAATPKAAAEGQDFVMACVGNDNDLRAITHGADGAFAGMRKGATFVDHTTASAEVVVVAD